MVFIHLFRYTSIVYIYIFLFNDNIFYIIYKLLHFICVFLHVQHQKTTRHKKTLVPLLSRHQSRFDGCGLPNIVNALGGQGNRRMFESCKELATVLFRRQVLKWMVLDMCCSLQDGPLLAINGNRTLINNLLTGFPWGKKSSTNRGPLTPFITGVSGHAL